MARKSTIEKLKTRISVLEKDRQRKVDEQIELILKRTQIFYKSMHRLTI